MRKYLNETILPWIPEEVRSRIVTVTKTQPSKTTEGKDETQTTEDDVWIPSVAEIFGSSSKYYELFQDTPTKRIKQKNKGASAIEWYTRKPSGVNNFSRVATNGYTSSYGYTTDACGVVLGFCT